MDNSTSVLHRSKRGITGSGQIAKIEGRNLQQIAATELSYGEAEDARARESSARRKGLSVAHFRWFSRRFLSSHVPIDDTAQRSS